MNINKKSDTQKVSPALLIILGFAVGAMSMALIATQTSWLNKAKLTEDQAPTPTPTHTATPPETTTTTPEPTLTNEEMIRQDLISETQIPEVDLEFEIGDNNGTVARGSVKNANEMSGAAWFAAKESGVWNVVYVGQGVPPCADVAQYAFPTTWISHCVESDGTTLREL